jgi:glycosyltransferase involved in cell wall biosynthesis
VLAFAGTGGGADMLSSGCGRTVPAFDIEAYASQLKDMLLDGEARASMGTAGRALIDEDFSFRGYVMDLVRLGDISLARVSVVVPNYNYAHYLRERLQSISQQTWPLFEIIVLDDCSTDSSAEVLSELRGGISPEPRIVLGERNSGSVFRQWLTGVEMARGEFVWIAEADDLAQPEFVERLVRAMECDHEVTMAYCQSEQIDEFGQVLAPDYLAYTNDLSRTRWSQPYKAEGMDEVDAGLGVKNTVPNVSAVLFRREALLETLRENIEEVAGYRIAGDWLVYLKLLHRGRVAFLSDSLNQHRRHGASVTLGSAAALHYDEVVRMQATARALFKLSPRTKQLADSYAQSLRIHFGLDSDQAKNP